MVLAILGMTTTAMAATDFETHWDGSGNVEVHFYAGDDAESHFWTGGSGIDGSFYATNYEDNPYGYNVNTTEAKVKANVTYGGYMEFVFLKNDNYESMYGPAGHQSYTFISTDNNASFAWKAWANYAQLRCCNHNWQANDQIVADGNHYIYHSLLTNDGDGAEYIINANGLTKISHMNDDTWNGSYKFGKGCGCYTNAKMDITGSGTLQLHAWGDNGIITDSGLTIDGNADYTIIAQFTTGLHFANFALEGN